LKIKFNMDKNGNITLSYETWKNGIKTPLTGMSDIVNVDIFDKPGIAKIAYAPTEVIKESDFTDIATRAVTSCAVDNNGTAWFGTNVGDGMKMLPSTYTLTEYTNATAANFQNAIFWKSFVLFTSYDSNNKRLNITSLNNSGSFDNSFVSMPNNSQATILGENRISRGDITIGIDDVVYVGSGRYVGSLTEVGNFDSTNAATYTWNNQALDLPENYYIDSLINFNDYLLVSAGYLNTRDQSLFPWDRVSSSFDYPTQTNNGVIAATYNKDNLLYYLDGAKGDFKVTNRSSVQKISELENIEYPAQNKGLPQKTKTIGLIDDVMYVGVSNDSIGVTPIGVYTFKNNAYTRLTLSNNYVGTNENILIHFVEPFEYQRLMVSWENDTTNEFGVDLFGYGDYRYTSYKAQMISPLYQVGLVLGDKSYQQIEVVLAKELSTGQGIRVSYRENLSDDWIVIGTYDYATYGAVSKINSNAGIINKTTLQLKVEMTTGTNSTTSPELISVKLF